MKKHSRWYTTGEAASIVDVGQKVIIQYCESGLLQFSRLPGGHRRIGHDALVDFMRRRGMVDELAKFGMAGVNILLCGVEERVGEELDELIRDGVSLHVANNGFELGWQLRDLRPSLVVLDGHNWPWSAFIGIVRWIRTRDQDARILALLCEDWAPLPAEVQKMVVGMEKHPVAAQVILTHIQKVTNTTPHSEVS